MPDTQNQSSGPVPGSSPAVPPHQAAPSLEPRTVGQRANEQPTADPWAAGVGVPQRDGGPDPVELDEEPVRLIHDGQDDLVTDAGPAPSSRRRKVLLGSALAVALVGLAGFGSFGWRIAQQRDTTLGTPVQVAGLTRDDSPQATGTAEYLRTGIGADIDLDHSVGAVYAEPGDSGRRVLLFGGTTLIWQPERDLDRLFKLVSGEEAPVSGIREVPPGNLGGVMKCGTANSPDGDLAVCGWADHGSVALAMFQGRDVDESAELFRQIRAAVQTRD